MKNSVYTTILQLQNAKGTLAKAKLLADNITDDDLKRFLKAVYEPRVNYYTTVIPKFDKQGVKELDSLYPVLDRLSSRVVTGGDAKLELQNIASELTSAVQTLLKIIITRDLKAGIGVTVINKVWPNLITDIPYQRCVLPKDAKLSTWAWGKGFGAFSQAKADGMYVNATVGSTVEFCSRNGSVFQDNVIFEQISKELLRAKSFLHYGDAQFHGELLVLKDGVVLPRERGNGILNSVLKIGVTSFAAYSLRFVCWDAIPAASAVTKGVYGVGYRSRYSLLTKAMMFAECSGVQLVETRIVDTHEDSLIHFNELLVRGEEGTVLKHPDAKWQDGNNRHQCKMKVEFTVDLVITGFNIGNVNGRHSVTFGSLECSTSCGQLSVGVSGMSDALRLEIFNNMNFYMGKIVAVSANAIMRDALGKCSLFLPRLLEVRGDKTTADSMIEVQNQYNATIGV